MLTPIPGDELRVGDVFVAKTDRRMKVERITLVTREGYPMEPLFEAHGPVDWTDGHVSQDWTEFYYGTHWVVVER